MSTIRLEDVSIQDIQIKQPKKYDDSYVCKVEYNDDKFNILIPQCKVLKVKPLNARSVYVFVKVSTPDLDGILTLEEYFVEEAKKNTKKWFSHKIKESIIEEYFQTSVAVHKEHGKILKIKIDNTNHELEDAGIFQPNRLYSIVLRLQSIKFLKQSFSLSWDLKEWTTLEETSWLEDTDDNSEFDGDANVDVSAPIDEIKEHLCSVLVSKINGVNNKVADLKQLLEWMERDLSLLTNDEPVSVSVLDEIAIRLAADD